ncbi:MAG: type II toxin-antitoxin system VapC family toxin [Ignavibacteria bacterium]|nr:type II toxin-antitoxin system VapC family toxin [Ignavibacteria bacterium]
MNLLLDTHAIIWYAENDKRLSSKAKKLIEDETNNVYISVASFWEIAIKTSLKKLEMKLSLKTIIERYTESGFELLTILPEHTLEILKLSFHHRDPFDRMLIAQSSVEKYTLVSKDEIFDNYHIKRIW